MFQTLLLLTRFQPILFGKTCIKDLFLSPHRHGSHLSDGSIRFGFCIFLLSVVIACSDLNGMHMDRTMAVWKSWCRWCGDDMRIAWEVGVYKEYRKVEMGRSEVRKERRGKGRWKRCQGSLMTKISLRCLLELLCKEWECVRTGFGCKFQKNITAS